MRFSESQSMNSIGTNDINQAILSYKTTLPNMWSKDYIGLYAQYAAVGLLYGMTGTLNSFCFYVYEGEGNLCSNAANIMLFAWYIKIFYAMFTDSYRPFGMRRKPWMVTGWVLVLFMLLILSITASSLNASTWLVLLLLVQAFVMLSDVPGDGYSGNLHIIQFTHKYIQFILI